MLYVAGEILLWMALAFVLGVLVGWFVWGVRRRAAGTATGAAKPADASAKGTADAPAKGTAGGSLGSTGDIESVTVRPAAKAAPSEAVAVAAAAASAAPVTPPAGTPIVAAPAEPLPDDTTAEVEVVPPGEPAPNAGLASLVADEGPRSAADSAAGAGDQGDLNERVAALEDEVSAAPTADAAAAAAARLAAAEDAATAQDVAEARAAGALGPDLAAGAAALGRKVATDDLKVVEGIGPRIEEVLKESGINTWSDLAAAAPDRLRTILDLAGDQFRVHDPGTWPRQAGLAAEGRWDELVELQDELSGGRPS